MKKLIKKYLIIIFLSLGCTSVSLAKTPNTTSCLQLSGKILKMKITSSNVYTVSLISDNTIIETKVIKGNTVFKFNLKKNGWYTVRILKDGYIPRLVSVDTKLAQEHDGFYKFQFDTELIDEHEALKLNKKALEIPIAHISFDKKKHWFTHNVAYTKEVKKKIYCGHVQLNR
ncbi:MAG: hypothetical protein ABIP51_08095 [Bacteroidia bacterium]